MDMNIRDLIADLRGGIPGVCDFCGRPTPEAELHPEEAGEWICEKCIDRIGYGPDPKPKTTVVHCRRSAYDVYIGRPSKWGNPFAIGRDGDRAEVIRKYREWLVKQPDLLAALPELRGKRLGCWCSPEPCHGDILAELADGC